MRRTVFVSLCALAITSATLATLSRAQQEERPARESAGRYVGGDTTKEWVACLDTWTGRIFLAPCGDELGGSALSVDMTTGRLIRRELGRDVSAGHALPHTLPVVDRGAGKPVFAWAGSPGTPIAILDTRTGAHLALVGAPGVDAKVVRTELRHLSRSVRPVRTRRE